MLCVRGSVGRSLASAKRFAAKCQWPETPPKSKQKCSGIREATYLGSNGVRISKTEVVSVAAEALVANRIPTPGRVWAAVRAHPRIARLQLVHGT